jgi:hypothetical protein
MAMNEGAVRQWCRMVRDRRTNVHDESEEVGRPSVVIDNLIRNVDQKICGRLHVTISELSYEFTKMSHTVFSTKLS